MAITLTGFEFHSDTGLPVVGATVEYWSAVDGTPAGAATGSTTTDSNGKWTFASLANALYDVKVTYSGRYRWYKGNSGFSMSGFHATSIANTNITATGTIQASDLTATDDLAVTDDATIGGDLAVTGTLTAPNTPRRIAVSVLGVDTASFDFTSLTLDGVYRWYEIVGKVRSSTGATEVDALIRFNNDSGANYRRQMTTHAAASAFTNGVDQTSGIIAKVPGDTGPTAIYGAFKTIVHPFDTTARPMWHGTFAHQDGTAAGDMFTGVASGYWDDMTDITRITILPSAGNWLAGSWVSIYGYP